MAHHLIRTGYRQVLLFDEKKEITAFVVERFRDLACRAIDEKGRFLMALSGGNTPKDIYTEMGRTTRAMPWAAIHMFLVDERFVPPDDEQSNYRMIERTLISAVPIPAANVHPVPTVGLSLAEAAERYEAELKQFSGETGSGMPRFDMILLGLGADGHTASLFPGATDLEKDVRLVRAVDAEGERIARISLSLPVINDGLNVFFIVTGAAKSEVLRCVVEEEDRALPAAFVRSEGELLFLCDREAASMLPVA